MGNNNVQFRTLPPFGGDQRTVAEVVRGIMDGKTNNTGVFTTTQSTTSSILYDERISYNSVIVFSPINDKGASELGTLYVNSTSKGQATISHGSHNFDCKYKYVVVG